MTGLAVYAGLSPAQVADLDEDEYDALVDAVREREQAAAWGNLHEAVAAAVEALWQILARLDAGVPVVTVAKTDKPIETGQYPRPEWIEGADSDPRELVVTSVRDALVVLKGGKANG